MTTIAEIADDDAVAARYAALADAAKVVASPQLRNQGTIAGNLCQKPRCWYYRGDFDCLRKGGELCYAYDGENQYHCIFGGDMCYIVHPSDTAPALAALGAVCRVSGPSASRSVPVESALRAALGRPAARNRARVRRDHHRNRAAAAPPPGLRSSYRKVRARASWDFALAGVALALVFDGDTVDLGPGLSLGRRADPVARHRTSRRPSPAQARTAATIAEAAEATVAGAEPLAKNGYKIELFKGLMTEQLEKMAQS